MLKLCFVLMPFAFHMQQSSQLYESAFSGNGSKGLIKECKVSSVCIILFLS